VLRSRDFFYAVCVLLSGDLRDPQKGLRVPLIEELQGANSYLHGLEDFQADLRSGEFDSNDGWSASMRLVAAPQE
jgi:hypothetical protein